MTPMWQGASPNASADASTSPPTRLHAPLAGDDCDLSQPGQPDTANHSPSPAWQLMSPHPGDAIPPTLPSSRAPRTPRPSARQQDVAFTRPRGDLAMAGGGHRTSVGLGIPPNSSADASTGSSPPVWPPLSAATGLQHTAVPGTPVHDLFGWDASRLCHSPGSLQAELELSPTIPYDGRPGSPHDDAQDAGDQHTGQLLSALRDCGLP